MINYYSGVDTEYFAGVGDIMVLCHRRLAVVNLFLFFQEPAAIPSRKERKKWVCQRLVCQKREFAARLSSCEVSRCEV